MKEMEFYISLSASSMKDFRFIQYITKKRRFWGKWALLGSGPR